MPRGLSACVGVAAGLVRRWRDLAGFGGALLVGVVAGLLLWPAVQREWMYRRLFSDEATQRQIALDWWRGPVGTDEASPSRLVESPSVAAHLTERIDGATEEPIFVEIASLLRESGYWRLPLISTAQWRRRLDLILDSGDDAAARSVIEEVVAADAARDDANAAAVWLRLLAWPQAPEIRARALRGAARWFDAEQVESFAAAARGDVDASVRRAAWLLLGQLRPRSGYAGQWKGEPAEVAEAMLWAATVTNPDDASPLLVACNQSPWPTPALPWLLSRSNDPAARARLEALVIDGNRAAALHMAERWGAGLNRLPAAQQAWLGRVVTRGEAEDPMLPMLDRWVAWRGARDDLGAPLDDPVAQDGSVWAAVLLAERLLSRDEAGAVAQRWLSDLSPAVRRGGVLLMGLQGGEAKRVSRVYQQSENPSLRRGARLAMLMTGEENQTPESLSTGRAYAWTVLAAQEDERMEAMFALLACGDEQAAEAILTHPIGSPSGAAMLERAWLIERFLPDYVAVVAPLCPWNDGIAALQFDIMREAFALGARGSAFDRRGRVFRYATATPPR